MINLIQTYIKNKINKDDLSFIIKRGFSSSKFSNGKIGVKVIDNRGNFLCYIKISRFKGYYDLLYKEYHIISFLHSSLTNKKILSSIPKPLGFLEKYKKVALLLEPLKGIPLLNLLKEKNSEDFLEKIIEKVYIWLGNFQKSTIAEKRNVIKKDYRDVIDLLLYFKIEELYINKIKKAFLEIKEQKIYYCCAHRDFDPKNMLIDNNEIRVLDWEYAYLKFNPFFDCIYFPLKLVFWISGLDRIDAFKLAFIKKNNISRIIKDQIIKFTDRMDLSLKCLKPYFIYPIIFHSKTQEELVGKGYEETLKLTKYIINNLENINLFK